MLRQGLFFCLFFILCLQTEGRVCTRTIQTFENTFTLSNCNYPECYGKSPQIKNLTVHDPILINKKMCCPGYCILDKTRQPSNTNCMKLCKKDCFTEECRTKEMCYFRGVYIEDDKNYQCYTSAPEETESRSNKQMKEVKTCLLGNCTNMSVYVDALGNFSRLFFLNMSLLEQEDLKEKFLSLLNCSDILIAGDGMPVKHGTSGLFVYASLIANVILLTILVIMLYRNSGSIKCCARKDQINSDAFAANNQHYLDMGGATRSPRMDRPPLIREKSDHEVGNEESPLRYDYVQVPLPVNQRLYEEIPPGR